MNRLDNAERRGRRFFFQALAGAAAAWSFPRSASAEVGCMENYQGRICEAGIASHLIHVHAVNNDQYMNQWCWAACISMIFGYYGHTVSQHRIVQECYGSIVNMPAQSHTILGALNRPWIDDAGNHFSAIFWKRNKRP
ncbi:hypothetical protein [Nannocystis pusilla]|uniref:hypothetical protein n=1 Tax=Nannocystis pusilla TaxID=889268 RepID=UPI003DA5C314